MNSNRIAEYIKRGERDRYWYHNTEKLFRELFGDDYLKLVTQLFAATSINSSLKSNIRLFRRALHEIETGAPMGKYLPVMAMQISAIRNGRPMSGRKIRSFAAAMSGDTEAVVVDVWLKRAFDEDDRYGRMRNGKLLMRSSGASDRVYDIIEYYVRDEARRRGLEPRMVSAMIWSGVRTDKATRYDDILRYQMFSMFDIPQESAAGTPANDKELPPQAKDESQTQEESHEREPIEESLTGSEAE